MKIGFIGAGPVTRMSYPSVMALGLDLRVLARSKDESAVQVVPNVVFDQSAEDFAQSVDVLITENPWTATKNGTAITAARSAQGQVVVYPATKCDGDVFITPADVSEDWITKAQVATLAILGQEDQVGLITVLFDDDLDVIEIQRGPSRAGLWTLDGAITNQFEQHLRAVLNLPFGSPEMVSEVVVTQMVSGGDKPELFRPFLHLFARDPGLRAYLYGVEVKPGVEIGHITVLGSEIEELLERADHAAGYLNGVIEE